MRRQRLGATLGDLRRRASSLTYPCAVRLARPDSSPRAGAVLLLAPQLDMSGGRAPLGAAECPSSLLPSWQRREHRRLTSDDRMPSKKT